MKAFVFPGQGAQFVGMGKDLYESSALAKELFEKAKPQHVQPQDWDTLSMGMSGDLDAAIAAGATIVRIGTALFGARDYSK